MSEQTPSQAEGERAEEQDVHPDVAQTTPSQAEGEREDDERDAENEGREPPLA